MKIVALLLFVILISGFRLPTIEVEFKGHLRSESHKRVGGFAVFAKGNIENGGVAISKKNGDFHLHFNQSLHDTIPVSFYYVNEHKDTILLKRVYTFESDEPEMIFWIK